MPSPNHPPVGRKPSSFDRKNLRRSVIAIPLREEIEVEIAESERLLKAHGKLLKARDNAAIFFREDVPLSRAALYARAREMLAEALKDVRGRTGQRIGKPVDVDDQRVCLAHLDGLVIRQILSMDAAASKEGRPSIIGRIWPTRFEVIIDINLGFKPPAKQEPDERPRRSTRRGAGTGRAHDEDDLEDDLDVRKIAKRWIARYIDQAKGKALITNDPDQGVDVTKTRLSTQYVFARLEARVIQELVAIDERNAVSKAKVEARAVRERVGQALGKGEAKERVGDLAAEAKKHIGRFRTIHHIWPDFRVESCITRSISTVKVDAAHRSFTALGQNITWAVADTGIDAAHPHFRAHKNVDPASAYHADFTGLAERNSALVDQRGHGTHVAGIIAGEQSVETHKRANPNDVKPSDLVAVWRELSSSDGQQSQSELKSMQLDAVSGMAPKCQLVSLKVLDRFGQGAASNVITAIAHIQAINHNGRELHIHGVNLSLGYPFDAKWFACGYSPLCVEVNRLVKSGVVVVVAAGNTGYGTLSTREGQSDTSLALTINDPGNAECAITVGSTHRDMPHMYGVSYFSSKGPTGDGRYKPDLLAPGEKIISCAAADSWLVEEEADNQSCAYVETSGTSMAAPHVSGAVAAFLSIRREFIGEPEKVKKILMSTATDLGRDRYFQGSGLVDLMRAIQSV